MIDAAPNITEERQRTNAFAVEAARLLEDRHCTDITLLDVHGLSQVCDLILIGSGTSDRQMKSVASELKDLAADYGQTAFRSNSDDAATWIITDFVDLVVHLFEPNLRAYYDLESLWSDAPRLSWQRDDAQASGATDAPADA